MSSAASGALPEEMAPVVSVVIPCLNEEPFIEGALRTILEGSYPRDRMEVLVVDGDSVDRTRELVERIAREDDRVRLLRNPRRATPSGLNIGIRASRGEIIVRADAHSRYPPDFVEGQVRALQRTGADMVGPREVNIPAHDGLMCHAILVALSSRFGTGSVYRVRREEGPVDAAVFGCWSRSLFDRVGLFDERLCRNQDNEHSSRILRCGGRIRVATDVCVKYYPRLSLRSLCRLAIANGTWNAFTQRLHPYTFRWRHFLPALFFLGVLFAAALALVGALTGHQLAVYAAAVIVAPYTLVNLVSAALCTARFRRLALAPLVGAVFATYHFAYGYGIVKGWSLVASGGWRKRLGVEADAGRGA